MLAAARGRGIKVCTDQIELALFLDGRLWLPPHEPRAGDGRNAAVDCA
jgi:hypothetical protein